jgi:hypothetical protein
MDLGSLQCLIELEISFEFWRNWQVALRERHGPHTCRCPGIRSPWAGSARPRGRETGIGSINNTCTGLEFHLHNSIHMCMACLATFPDAPLLIS